MCRILFCLLGILLPWLAKSQITSNPCLFKGEIIDQYAPAVLKKNDSTEVWVRAVNTGNLTWVKDTIASERIMIGIRPDQPNGQPWGFGRVLLQEDTHPGDTTTFRFKIASDSSGYLPFRWQLLHEQHCWFGNWSDPDSVKMVDNHYGGDSIHHIGIRTTLFNKEEFYHRETNNKFIPRGANHVRTINGKISMLDPGVFDPDEIANYLYQMRHLGYNTIRVLSHPSEMSTMDGPTPAMDSTYIANIKTLLTRCREQNIYLMFTFPYHLGIPYQNLVNEEFDFETRNGFYLDSSHISARTQYFTDCYHALKEQQAPIGQILSWGFVNEFHYWDTLRPLEYTSGIVTPANGNSYDMSSQVDRVKMMKESAQYVANTWTAAMKAVDSTGLCTIGWFTPLAVDTPKTTNPRVTVPGVTTLENTNIDYIDVHAYPTHSLDRDLDNILGTMGVSLQVDKPMILGEFGFFKSEFTEAEMQDSAEYYMTRSCQLGVDGWVYWTWDIYQPSDRFWNMLENNEAVSQAIAPINDPVICLGVSSSKYEPETDDDPTDPTSSMLRIAYPNPVENELNLEFTDQAAVDRVQLYNSVGQYLWEGRPIQDRLIIEMQDRPAGVYWVRIVSTDPAVSPETLTVIRP